MRPELKIATVDGKKTLLVNGRTLVPKPQVLEQIAALRERATRQLPAARAKLNAQELLAQAEANIDRQIAQALEAQAALEAVLKELD